MEKGKPVFFGCPLDSEESQESLDEKLSLLHINPGKFGNPYNPIIDILKGKVGDSSFIEAGSIDVPTCLQPFPLPSDLESIRVENFVAFIDGGGCREFAEKVGGFISQEIFPDTPIMIGVDHSLTGGAFKKLKELVQKEISLIVLDSHTDAIPVPILSGLIEYDMETNSKSHYKADDPFLYGRVDSYNASSFLLHLINEKILLPKDLYIIGVSDLPPKRAYRIKDERVREYVSVFTDIQKKGVKILTKKDLAMRPSRLNAILSKIETPYVYVSIDMDIGANNALNGVRFRNRHGLSERQIFKVVDTICKFLKNDRKLIGMDIMEINPRTAGPSPHVSDDNTYEIAASIVRKMITC